MTNINKLFFVLLCVIGLHTTVNAQLSLQILHNNDGESQLLNAGSGLENYGGVAYFKAVVDSLRAEAASNNQESIMLSSGDNFLPGPEFNASFNSNGTYYDAIAMDSIGYDAVCIGNHDFDFGPEVLADFINSFATTQPPYLSANLDFTGEADLQALVNSGRITTSTIVTKNGEEFGIIGLTTPSLPTISSPRNVEVDTAITSIVQTEVNALISLGINKIILISHLQSIEEEIALAGNLTGVDVIIAGGGDEMLTNNPNDTLPGNPDIYGPYPYTATDMMGNDVYVVTTPGEYRYVGQLIVDFDANGNVTSVDAASGPVKITHGSAPDAALVTNVINPVQTYVDGLATNVIGSTDVDLDGVRNNVRTMETNEGNLVADALLWQAKQEAANFNVDTPMVALQNGGGIRNNTVIAAGSDITELTTFDILPFSNFVSIMAAIPASQFKEVMENAVSAVEFVSGRFAQVSGFTMVWDSTGTAQELDNDGNVLTAGSRVWEITLNDGTKIVENGMVVSGAPAIRIATIDFLARGGDNYPYRDSSFTSVGVSYQQALYNYIVDELNGDITAARYPSGGEGRITIKNVNSIEDELFAATVTVYPNPFADVVNITYELEAAREMEVYVTDVTGKVITRVFAGKQAAGAHKMMISADLLGANGVYMIVMKSAGRIQALPVMMNK